MATAAPFFGTTIMTDRPFRILGVQQIALGSTDRQRGRDLWVDMLGFQSSGFFRSESENVDEEILRLNEHPHSLEVDLMQPLDQRKKPRIDAPALHHVGLWVDDLEAAFEWLTNHGVRFAPGGIRTGGSGMKVCFIHPHHNDQFPIAGGGVLLELVQAPNELIEST